MVSYPVLPALPQLLQYCFGLSSVDGRIPNKILINSATEFDTDLAARKSTVKLMIQEELTKLADADVDEEDEGNAEKDEKAPSGKGVKAT